MTIAGGRINYYRYRGIDAAGRVRRGIAAQASDAAMLADLRRRGLAVLSMSRTQPMWRRRHSLRPTTLSLLLRTLGELLASGLAPDQAAALLPEVLPTGMRPVIAVLRDGLSEGLSITSAIDSAVGHLPADVRGVLEAGEMSGDISSALATMASELDESAALKSQVAAALAYPTLLVCSTLALLTLLGTVFLPRLLAMLGAGAQLPWLAAVVVWCSQQIRWALPLSAVVGVCAGMLIVALYRTSAFRPIVAEALLRIPVLGPLRRDFGSTRIGAVLGAALGAGLPATKALELARGSTSDFALSERAARAQSLLLQGVALSESFATTGTLTPALVRLVRLGEATGGVARLLSQGARIERQRLLTSLQRGIGILQPILLQVIGGVIGSVAIGMLQAVYGVRVR